MSIPQQLRPCRIKLLVEGINILIVISVSTCSRSVIMHPNISFKPNGEAVIPYWLVYLYTISSCLTLRLLAMHPVYAAKVLHKVVFFCILCKKNKTKQWRLNWIKRFKKMWGSVRSHNGSYPNQHCKLG